MYPIGSGSTTKHSIVSNDINQTQITNVCTTPFINRPSLFSSSHHQHQPYETVVNPELPISGPNDFQWPPRSHHALQQQQPLHGLNIPETGVPWKCPEWMANQNIQPGSYMNFNGHQQHRLQVKRKATPDMDPDIQSKQLITEEKMAAHLDGLHISSEFTAHDINQTISGSSSDMLSPYPASLQEIEEKLKRAQKITVSDVVKTIQEEPILPAAIMERFEKPCKALIIWQPPQRITDLIISKTVQEAQNSDDESADNNNVEFVDAYNDLQMEMDN